MEMYDSGRTAERRLQHWQKPRRRQRSLGEPPRIDARLGRARVQLFCEPEIFPPIERRKTC
jgi:hypothetical protein